MANFFSNLLGKAQTKIGQIITGIKPENLLTPEAQKRAEQKGLYTVKPKTNFFASIVSPKPENILSEEARTRLTKPETPAIQRMGTEFAQRALQPETRNFFSDLISKETFIEARKKQFQLPVFKQIAKAGEFLRPKTEEEAGKMGLVRIGGTEERPTYFDVTAATGALKTVQDVIGEEFLSLVKRTSLTKTAEEFVVGVARNTRNKIAQALKVSDPIQATKEFFNKVKSGVIKKELQPLAQEARKYQNRSQFLEKIANVDGKGKSDAEVFALLKNAEKAWDSQGIGFGKDVIQVVPIKDIKIVEQLLAVKPKAGRSITEPIEIVYIKGEPTLVDGRHRLGQAIANGEKTIKARVSGQFIPKELEPLAIEARKYKSAEGFVGFIRTKSEPIYRGTQGTGELEALKRGEAITGNWNFSFDTAKKFALEDLRDRVTKGIPVKGEGAFVIQGARLADDSTIPVKVLDAKTGEVVKGFTHNELLTDFYNQVTRGIRELPLIKPPTKPPAIPEVSPKNTIQKLIKAIDEAVPLRAEQKKLYQAELAKRTARVAAMGEKVGGEAGLFAQLGQLKGPLPKKEFEAIRGKFGQQEIDSLFNTIEQTKTLLPLEKVGTKEGLRKLFEGVVPTPGEIENLREVFPKELIDSVLARRPLLAKAKELIGEIINVPRTLMATLDLSAPFRQGVFMLGRPVRFAQAFKDMFKFAVSERAYQGLIEGIKTRPTYLKMKQGRLALTEIGGPLLKREERFMGNLAEKIPGYGALVRGSNRAYTGFLNKLRADIFDDILTKAKIVGRDVDDPLLKSIADFVNAGTGRGKFGLAETGIIPKSMERAAIILNGVFFSPRLMASRLNLLNPNFYVQLDPFVRKEAVRTLFATSGILGSIYGLWKLNGGDVGIDPRNADFGKVKVGNTRYDLLGGFQQYIRLAAQLITGEIISSTTGRTITLGEGYKPLTRKEIILRFFENKTSPIASFIIGLLTGQTATGEDVDVPTEVVNRFVPMVVQDLYDLSQESGAEGILYGLPAIFGAGLQTYGKQELVSGESKLGEPTAQIRPVPELADKIRELVLGQLPLGTSKGFSIEAYFSQLSDLPREEAADIFDKIAKANPELAKKLSDVVKERELGITVKDKDLKAKGVASGDRTLAIKKELDKLKTKEEKAALWNDYVKKGIITKKVSEQLLKLLNQ